MYCDSLTVKKKYEFIQIQIDQSSALINLVNKKSCLRYTINLKKLDFCVQLKSLNYGLYYSM